ncbi:hypothetical protein DQW50_15055 [Halorubrum sp. 48-1-W]|uniref:hypothetical protein n=1 Tax=Halorubrum sp. 48-1-W TaxID=2249761 RepID=UPI000DCC48DD|nr:hypothetical protein [Halorubrum sp. 48-1-W]RAW44308.1 hypothetical protein DQW50_15055 [Halorubrum sp. 48-1-W]
MSEEVAESDDPDQSALLSMYDQLRQEVRAHGKRKTRRNLGSFTVIGLIVGYIFTSNGDGRVLVLVPYVLAFLYLAHISSVNYVIQLAALLALIETQIDVPGAEYEYYHGGLDIDTSPRFESVDGVDYDQAELQETVQSHVRNTMKWLAVVAYLGAALGGSYILLTQGLPEIGFEVPSWLLFSKATYLAALVLLTQAYLFWCPIRGAWNAYGNHRDVLSTRVRDAYKEDLKGNMEELHLNRDSDES